MSLRPVSPANRSSTSARWVLLCFIALASAMPLAVCAQIQAAALDQVEAAYIVKFANYVEWPARVFSGTSDPMVLGVMDDAELARALELSVRGRVAQGRPLQVRHLQAGDRLSGVHLLVLPRADDPERRRVMLEAAGQPILTISPTTRTSGPSPSHAVIHLVLENERLRFDVNLPAPAQGLKVSALMLTAARQVIRSPR